MSDSTINLETFLTLIQNWGSTESMELVAETLNDMGWGDKEAFTKNDVIEVMGRITAKTQQRLVQEPEAFAGSTAAEREHMGQLLGAVSQHALPLLKEG